MIGPTSHSFFSQRLRLHYVDWGNKDAPPLILVHGGRDHCRNWDWVAQELCKDYHIIAPDLRGHGDSQWVNGTTYPMTDHVYDLNQLLNQTNLGPVRIIAHSLGSGVSFMYSGLFSENVTKLLAIEGAGNPPEELREIFALPTDERLRHWLAETRQKSGRIPRRYPSLEAACQRMQEENPHLRADQALHLTIHGANQNEDGTYSWKFDSYVRSPNRPNGISHEEMHELWGKIECPVLLARGKESWSYDPDGDNAHLFQNARVVDFDNAGHWIHHDQLDKFLEVAINFLKD